MPPKRSTAWWRPISTLSLLDEAKKNGAVLGANYPGDRWYADAYLAADVEGPAARR